jgi:catechol 2,3-dioxygenase-like lactoylglutathione lyase family enzyme
MNGILGVHHVALTVADLDSCARFYEGLGFKEERRLSFEGEGAECVTGVRHASLKMAFLMLDDFRLELIQFTPPGRQSIAAINDPGSGHICLRVQDIESVYSRLTERGTSFTSPPYHDASGVSMGYFTDPEGNRLEVLELGKLDGE